MRTASAWGWLYFLLGVLSILAVLLLAWAFWPLPEQTVELVLEDSPWEADQSWQALRVRLVSPVKVRAGETGAVRLFIKPAEQAQPEAISSTLLVTRLDLPGMEVSPSGEISILFSTSDELSVTWKVRAYNTGDFGGTAWLYVENSVQEAPPKRLPVSAQEFALRVTGLSWAPLLVVRRAAAALVGGVALLWLVLLAQKKKRQ